MTRVSSHDDYGAALRFLYDRINYEQFPPVSDRPRRLNLEQMRLLLGKLGEPQNDVPIVHIAGTKGKGSTAAMVSSILSQAGYRTGLYTSPHLERLEERYVIDGESCRPADLVALTESIRPVVEEIDQELKSETDEGGLTFFEITTAMAFQYFAQRKTDIVVLEVGMGGRLDSTNVCMPLVSVITSISFDHTRHLGNTLAAIAREKAGIIKPGVPVVSGVDQPEPRQVITEIAASRHAPLYTVGNQFDADYALADGKSAMTYREQIDGQPWQLEKVHLNLLGRHQARNAAVTLAVIGRLKHRGWSIHDDAIRNGLAQVRCPARIEVVRQNPTVIVDTAHNVASIQTLVDTLDERFPNGRRSLICAVSKDKDVRGMLRILQPHFDVIYLTQYMNNPRAVPPHELARMAEEVRQELAAHNNLGRSPVIHICETPVEAWSICQATLGQDDLACVTGSFFLASDLRRILLGGETSRGDAQP